MKDKLRELADEMEACWICASIGEGEITLETINNWSGRLSAIINAEGDGGASQIGGLVTRNPAPNAAAPMVPSSPTVTLHVGAYTHPARSGVVSDEDVEAALIVYEETTHDDALKSGMRTALENFAKGERHGR